MKSSLLLPLVVAAIAVSAPAHAQSEALPPLKDDQAIGLFASMHAGSGATYIKRFANGWGYHVSGIGWGQGASSFVNLGAAVTRDFDRRDWGTLYGFGAVGGGIGSFFGGGGLPGATNIQANVTPGFGWTWGPFIAEAGLSVYTNSAGLGFGPSGGLGMVWWF